MDTLKLVMRLPDGVMVQLDAQAMKVRRERLTQSWWGLRRRNAGRPD
jgi:hypothetical protein